MTNPNPFECWKKGCKNKPLSLKQFTLREKFKKGQGVFGEIAITIIILLILFGLVWYIPHFSFGWDTGVMVGKKIGLSLVKLMEYRKVK